MTKKRTLFQAVGMFERTKRYLGLQHSQQRRDILTAPASAPTPGNPYPTYGGAVVEFARKYEGAAEWGCHAARNVVDIRAAYAIGDGVQPVAVDGMEEEAKRELDFLQEFLRWNELEHEDALNWAREAEIEGKVLAVLKPDNDGQHINARLVPWTQHRYKIEADPTDYAVYRRATYRVDGSGADVTLAPDEFVFRPFGGRAHTVNEPTPKGALVLREMEALDKALVDWRSINKLFASAFPHFKCANKSEVDAVTAYIKANGWRIGQAIATTAEASFLGAPMGGVASLLDEITTNVKIISGVTGVAAHFLGFPDMLANRSTSDNLFEAMEMAVKKERATWEGWYGDLFQKALKMANNVLQRGFNPNIVTARIAEADAARLALLSEVWLPLYSGGVLSRETMLGKIPGVDAVAEEKRLADSAAKQARSLMDRMNLEGMEE